MLRLHDTASGEVRELRLRTPGQVSMYVCGPTVYDSPHLGHGRFSLVFDVLRRYLLFTGLDVTYVSNITDIDDKIIERAAEQGVDPGQLADRYEAVWWQAMDALGVLRPSETPHATGYVAHMVSLVEELVGRGVAYETSDGVYLSVADVPGYGLLAHQPLDSLRAGARVEGNEEKRSPLDFVLWKKAKPGEPWWESPWGPGRPGWHTECVVMSLDLLGDGFELHGGGLDLMFPHHENERAQSVALGREFARHWMHNGWVVADGEKMSKSLGNFTSLDDLLERTDARCYRLLVLRSHYRSPIEVTPDTVAQAESGLARLDELARRFELGTALAAGPVVDTSSGGAGDGAPDAPDGTAGTPDGRDGAVGGTPDGRGGTDGSDGRDAAGASGADLDAEAVARFRERMDDDLDTPGALAGVFDLVRRANSEADRGDGAAARRTAATAAQLCAALGLPIGGEDEAEIDGETAELVRLRDEARAQRAWDRADALRDELAARGWLVEDGPEGTRVRRP